MKNLFSNFFFSGKLFLSSLLQINNKKHIFSGFYLFNLAFGMSQRFIHQTAEFLADTNAPMHCTTFFLARLRTIFVSFKIEI